MGLFDFLSKKTAEEYFFEAEHLTQLGQHSEAVASFDKGLAINPNYAAAWYNRGIALKISVNIQKQLPHLTRQLLSTQITSWHGTIAVSR
jgi:tetratricopeptide (TPR) repeat protein